jgi:hypothetical protein
VNVIFHSSSWAAFEALPSRTLTKIDSFASLPVGWDYGDGVPASVNTVSLARGIFYELTQLGFTRTEAFPGTDGGIQVTAYEGDSQYIIVIVKPSGKISLTHKINGIRAGPSVVATDHNLGKIKTSLREIARNKWNIFVFSTPSNLITYGGVTQRLPLQTMSLTVTHL